MLRLVLYLPFTVDTLIDKKKTCKETEKRERIERTQPVTTHQGFSILLGDTLVKPWR